MWRMSRSNSIIRWQDYRVSASRLAESNFRYTQVWLHLRFPLSLRLVEEMVPERRIVVSYETIRCWAIKFDPDYARRLKSDVVCAG